VSTQRLGLIVILAGLMAFAPMSIDMYLPALPELARVLGTDAAHAQITLATFFLGFAIGQAFYGPVSDRFGRKPPLYVSLSLYTLASLGCALAPGIEELAALRFLQALGACAGAVIARAVVRDLFESHEAVKVLSALTLVFGLAPILAPLIGGYLLLWFGWQAIFYLLAGFGVVSLIAVIFGLPETHRPENTRSLALGAVLGTYWHLLCQRRFLGYALCGGFGSAGMFAYIAGSPFVFIELFGVAPQHYGWFFGTNAIGLVMAAQINGWLHRHAGSHAILNVVVAVQALAGLALLADAVTGLGDLFGIAVPLFLFVASLGFISANTTVLAMEPFKATAGAASALMGTLQFGLAAMAALGVSTIPSATALPMASVIAACGVLGLLMLRVTVKRV